MSLKLFLGLGFPFEGPAPLEAIANGAVYINPMFDIPHSYGRDGKPTERNVREDILPYYLTV